MTSTRSSTFATLGEFLAWCERAPAGTQLDAREVARILASVGETPPEKANEVMDAGEEAKEREPWTWRERLWTVPPETRLTVSEVAEALARPKSFIYARTYPQADDAIPHRRIGRSLRFIAGEIREWIQEREDG